MLRICSNYAKQNSVSNSFFDRCIVIYNFINNHLQISRKLLVNFCHFQQYKNSLTKRGGGYSIKESVCAKSRRSIIL